MFDDLLMEENCGLETFLKIFHINPLSIEDEDWSEIFIPSTGVEHASILNMVFFIR